MRHSTRGPLFVLLAVIAFALGVLAGPAVRGLLGGGAPVAPAAVFALARWLTVPNDERRIASVPGEVPLGPGPEP